MREFHGRELSGGLRQSTSRPSPPFFLEITRLGNDAVVGVISRNRTRHLLTPPAKLAEHHTLFRCIITNSAGPTPSAAEMLFVTPGN
jgi:hypothetical protein